MVNAPAVKQRRSLAHASLQSARAPRYGANTSLSSADISSSATKKIAGHGMSIMPRTRVLALAMLYEPQQERSFAAEHKDIWMEQLEKERVDNERFWDTYQDWCHKMRHVEWQRYAFTWRAKSQYRKLRRAAKSIQRQWRQRRAQRVPFSPLKGRENYYLYGSQALASHLEVQEKASIIQSVVRGWLVS